MDRGCQCFVDCDHSETLFPIARRLQRLVFYVDVLQLDLDTAIRLFTRHRLWTALVRVYCALRDYTSPLELLTGESTELARKCSTGVEKPLVECRLVKKLFFFLHRCFELRPFPLDSKDGPGMVPPGLNAIPELLQCIFRPDSSTSCGTSAPPLFVRLLRLSPFGFFTALSVLYTSPSAGRAIQKNSLGENPWVLGDEPLSLSSLFHATECAVELALSQSSHENHFLPSNVEIEFSWFVARAAAKNTLAIPAQRHDQAVEHLFASGQTGGDVSSPALVCHSSEEAQQLLIGMVANQPALTDEKRSELTTKSVQAGFFSVASWLYEENRAYDRALDCQMRDDRLREGIFEYIICKLAEMSNDQNCSTAFVDATLNRLSRLVAIDEERCAAMVCEQFANLVEHDRVLTGLKGYPQIELQYLENLLLQPRGSHWNNMKEQQAFFDSHVVRYVELLCALTPASVLPFLVDNEMLPLRECLELCRRHCVTDASVHLLERTGDFEAVLELFLGDYEVAIDQLCSSFMDVKDQNRALISQVAKRLAAAKEMHEMCGEVSSESWWEGFQHGHRCVDLLEHANQLSSRNSNLMMQSQLEELWFGVLKCTIQRQERVSQSNNTSKRHSGLAMALADLLSRVMTGVLMYLSLPRSLQRVCSEFSNSALGIWKKPLDSMLSGLSFQQGLLQAAKAVAAQDVVAPFMTLKRRGSQGVRVGPGNCVVSPTGALKVSMVVREVRGARLDLLTPS